MSRKVDVAAECSRLYRGIIFVRQHARNPVFEDRRGRHRHRGVRSSESKTEDDQALKEKGSSDHIIARYA